MLNGMTDGVESMYYTRLVDFAEITKGCVETFCYPQDEIRSILATGNGPIYMNASS